MADRHGQEPACVRRQSQGQKPPRFLHSFVTVGRYERKQAREEAVPGARVARKTRAASQAAAQGKDLKNLVLCIAFMWLTYSNHIRYEFTGTFQIHTSDWSALRLGASAPLLGNTCTQYATYDLRKLDWYSMHKCRRLTLCKLEQTQFAVFHAQISSFWPLKGPCDSGPAIACKKELPSRLHTATHCYPLIVRSSANLSAEPFAHAMLSF